MGGNHDQLLANSYYIKVVRTRGSWGELRALCSTFLQVKQTNKINLELKEKKSGG